MYNYQNQTGLKNLESCKSKKWRKSQPDRFAESIRAKKQTHMVSSCLIACQVSIINDQQSNTSSKSGYIDQAV